MNMSLSRIHHQQFDEVSGHNLKNSKTAGFRILCYITNQFQPTFAQEREEGIKSVRAVGLIE
jgi:hypothetical protein